MTANSTPDSESELEVEWASGALSSAFIGAYSSFDLKKLRFDLKIDAHGVQKHAHLDRRFQSRNSDVERLLKFFG